MADFETPTLGIVLEPERNEFVECYFFSEGSFKPTELVAAITFQSLKAKDNFSRER